MLPQPLAAAGGLLVAMAALWAILLNQLRVEWGLNEQYGYGWFVPFLAIYLFLQAWRCRPQPGRPESQSVLILIPILLFLLLPVRLVQEANPDWRLVSWSLALLTVGITWCGLYVWGGGKWWRHFAFSTAFILVAVPWPSGLEQAIVQGLMRLVSGLSVEVLIWLGVPAFAAGSVIATPVQVVGVDEACSGVRSLQTILMAGLFLGELFRLPWKSRVLLLGGGMILAFGVNVLRTLALVGVVIVRKDAGFNSWHDPVGWAALAISLAGLAGLTFFLQRNRKLPEPVAGEIPPMDCSRAVTIGLLLWLVVVELGTQGWYGWHERGMAVADRWTVAMPVATPGFKAVELSTREQQLLRADEIQGAAWQEDDFRIAAYFFRWLPGRNAAQLARLHRPEICLPAVGCVLQRDEGIVPVEVAGLTLPFRAQIFCYDKGVVTVFHCLWEDRVQQVATGEDWSVLSRLRAVAEGRRHLGQQVLEIVIVGPDTYPQTVDELRRIVTEIVRRSNT